MGKGCYSSRSVYRFSEELIFRLEIWKLHLSNEFFLCKFMKVDFRFKRRSKSKFDKSFCLEISISKFSMNTFYTNLFVPLGKHIPFIEIKGKNFIFNRLKGSRFTLEYYRLILININKERAQYIVDLLRASQTLFEGVFIDPDEFHISVS